MRYEIVVSGQLCDDLSVEFEGLPGLSVQPAGGDAATTVLHVDLPSPDDLTSLLEKLQDLGLGLTALRIIDDP